MAKMQVVIGTYEDVLVGLQLVKSGDVSYVVLWLFHAWVCFLVVDLLTRSDNDEA